MLKKMDYKQITPEEPEGDLSSLNPCQLVNENENKNKNESLKKNVFDLDYNDNYFLFSIK